MIAGHFQRLREWWALLPLLLLLGATYWLNQQVQPMPKKQDGSKRHNPDFIITQLAATTLNDQGEPHFVLSAKKMIHFPDNDSTLLEFPQLSSLYSTHPTIYTYATQGEVSSKGDEVYLRDEVKLVRAGSATQSEMTFTTHSLHVVPDTGLMDTRDPVTLRDAHSTLQAVGMRLDNKARTIKLLSQVNSQHEIVRQ